MYPNLYYLFKDIFGIELGFLQIFQSFGVLVAISFLFAAYFFSKELQRKEKDGLIKPTEKKYLKGEPPKISEIILSAVLGFIIFYKLIHILLNFHAFTQDTQGFILSKEGNIIGGIAGAALLAFMRYREKKKEQLPKPEWVTLTLHPYQHVPNMTLIAAIAGILGAKIFHNLENLDEFMRDPIGSLISFSGLTMYGGLIVASFSVIYYARKNGITTTHLIDACAPALMLAYGVGRIGCQLAGDGDWGIENLSAKPSWFFLPDWVWGYTYPHNVNNVGIPIEDCTGKFCSVLEIPVFPTPLWEAIICIALFFVLWAVRKKITVPGMMFSVYLILNGFERFFIEKIRVNNKYDIFGMQITQAEIIAVVLFLLGTIGIFYFKKQSREKKVS
ncbi:MAG: prolipoprotein diacylglyceryl transferase [Bacteroidetes bacterium]|nr:prolipoprotein diacylglyceryl transferase [Bacteroidota bacterium]